VTRNRLVKMIGWTLGMSLAIFLMLSKGVDSPLDHTRHAIIGAMLGLVIGVHNWYESGLSAVAYSNLLLYQRFFGDSPEVEEGCFRQVSGGAIAIHFKGLRQSP
jgi:hypothetical protein